MHKFMKGGNLIYKCRRCGAEDKSTHVPVISTLLTEIVNDGITDSQWGAIRSRFHEIHVCNDGHFGVTDLIGGEIDE